MVVGPGCKQGVLHAGFNCTRVLVSLRALCVRRTGKIDRSGHRETRTRVAYPLASLRLRPFLFISNKMAEPTGENDSAIVVKKRGEGTDDGADTNADRQIEAQPNPAQNQPAPQQEGSPWKSMIVRMVIFWLVIQFFKSRGGGPPTGPSSAKNVDPKNPNGLSGTCYNLFKNGDVMVSFGLVA